VTAPSASTPLPAAALRDSAPGGSGPASGDRGVSGTDRAKPRADSTAELEALGHAVRRLMSSMRRLRGHQLQLGAQQITYGQFELLLELSERGALPAGELAGAIGLTPATVTGMLDQLVACGYVCRTRSDSDRRVVACELTADGHSHLAAHRETKQRRWESALAGAPAADVRAATRVVEMLCGHCEDSLQSAAERGSSTLP
jgi:DNA-binding MarR family transcriptional regulator